MEAIPTMIRRWATEGKERSRRRRCVSAERFEEFVERVELVLDALDQRLSALEQQKPIPGVPVSADIIIGGISMPGQITVDTKNETVSLEFKDDKGNTTDVPTGASVAFASSNPATATIAADATNPLQGDITPVAPGTTDISATITGATDAGGKPFTVTPATVTVKPGPAAGADLVLSA